MKNIFFIIITLMFLLLNNISAKELIAYDQQNKIFLLDFKGNIKKVIKLPQRIKNSFKINRNVVCFIGEDNQIHWYNWKKKNERKVPKGPYIYKEKGYGPEIYKKIDFSQEKEFIILSIDLEYEIYYDESGKKIINKTIEADYEDVGLINLKTNRFKRVDKEGYAENPTFFSKGIIAYNVIVEIILYDPFKNEYKSLNDIYNGIFNKKYEVCLYALKFIKDDLIFFEYIISNKNLIIYQYNLFKKDFKKIKDLKNNMKDIKREFIKDISRDYKYLLLAYEKDIFLLDLKTFKKKLVKTTEEKIQWAQFYELYGK